jgi:hypothetical protein
MATYFINISYFVFNFCYGLLSLCNIDNIQDSSILTNTQMEKVCILLILRKTIVKVYILKLNTETC